LLDALLDESPGNQATGSGAGPGLELVNDLQAVAQRLEPQIEEGVLWLKSRWGNGLMTGSGSAVFARETADNAPLMAAAAGRFASADLPVGWVGRSCRSLERHPLWEA